MTGNNRVVDVVVVDFMCDAGVHRTLSEETIQHFEQLTNRSPSILMSEAYSLCYLLPQGVKLYYVSISPTMPTEGRGGECDQKLNMIKCCCRISKSARDKVLPTAHFSLLQDTLLCITAVTSYLSRRDDGRGASPRIPIYIVSSTTSHRHL